MTAELFKKAEPAEKPKPTKPHYVGHRSRLKSRFVEKGAESLAAYEKLELLLFLAIPRGDVKPLAKQLLSRFGSVGAVLTADSADLKEIGGIGEGTIASMRAMEMAAQEILKTRMHEVPVLKSFQAVIEYCKSCMSHLKTEQIRLLFLDSRQQLIRDEVHQQGTVNEVNAHVREIVKRALELGAVNLIMVHNHPSGKSDPSKADIEFTNRTIQGLQSVDIHLIDHIIIGKNEYSSLRKLGYIV